MILEIIVGLVIGVTIGSIICHVFLYPYRKINPSNCEYWRNPSVRDTIECNEKELVNQNVQKVEK